MGGGKSSSIPLGYRTPKGSAKACQEVATSKKGVLTKHFVQVSHDSLSN